MRTVRIGNGQGFWGDDLEAPVRQVEGGPLDYLVLDPRAFETQEGTWRPWLQTRLLELLTKGKEPLLRRLLAGARPEELVSLQSLLQRGVDESIDHLFTDVVMRALPAELAGSRPNFWDGDRIWTTKRGLEKRRAELRHLMEVKIPANQEAIGRAASMGDLSENSEWEMAIEEQRNLTSRAAQIEAELRHVELIDNALLSEETVSPGTTVRYREGGAEHEITILGPWDTDEGDVVSYRAPLAAGLPRVGTGWSMKLNRSWLAAMMGSVWASTLKASISVVSRTSVMKAMVSPRLDFMVRMATTSPATTGRRTPRTGRRAPAMGSSTFPPGSWSDPPPAAGPDRHHSPVPAPSPGNAPHPGASAAVG